ncbi:MAG TPA: zf-HC2 domain-containing protein [Myxococcota bacterium]|nr:zf-HC2 domain-containing protein [Myxococcota bacterium]
MTRRIDVRLSAYLDGELPARERTELEPALAEAELARQLAALRALEHELRELPQLEPGADFEARFRARLAAERTAQREPFWRRLRALGAGRALVGACALAGAIALAVWLRRPQPIGPELEQVAEIRDPETWDMLRSEDVELFEVLEILEAWDGVQES